MKSVTVAWDSAAERFVASAPSGTGTVIDAPHRSPETVPSGMTPAELLLAAAGACSAWDVVEILRKQRQAVDAVEVEVDGDQEADPPWPFRSVTLRFTIRGRGVRPELAERAVRLSEEKYCSVTATIRAQVQVGFEVAVVESAGAAVDGDAAGTAAGSDTARSVPGGH